MIHHPINDKLQGLLRDQLAGVVENLGPAHIMAYLAEAGWRAIPDQAQSNVQVWVRTKATDGCEDGEEEVYASVMVPLFATSGDYGRRMEEVLNTVAVVDEWPLSVALEVPALLRGIGGTGA